MKLAKYLSQLLQKQKNSNSPQMRWLLNLVFPHVIPFNKPMGLKVLSLTENGSEVLIPLKRANYNHLGTIHAGALATVGEYTAGILVLCHFDFSKYRLILKTLNAEYFKQAKKNSKAISRWNESSIVKNPDGSMDVPMLTELFDIDGLKVAEVKTLWQVKSWDSVKTK